MNQQQLIDALIGKTIVKINFKSQTEYDTTIDSINLMGGELLTLNERAVLSHPEREEEENAFFETLKNIPANGIISFKAKFLNKSIIEKEILKRAQAINAGSHQIKEDRFDFIAYKFDLPH